MPKRPQQHRLETASRSAFEAVLPEHLLFRREADDYGIDGSVEEFEVATGETTGVRFYVQLKSTDGTNALATQIKVGTASYYRSLASPALMVLYHRPSDTVYTRWFHQYERPPKAGDEADQKEITFRWFESDAWTPDRADELIAEVRAFRELRSATLRLPLPIYVCVQEPLGASQIGQAQLVAEFRRLVDRCPDAVAVALGDPPPAAALVEFANDQIAARLAGVTSMTLHIDETYAFGVAGAQAAIDGLILMAVALDRLGQADVAARLTASFLADSSLLRLSDVLGSLAAGMTRSHRVIEALAVAESLDRQEGDGREVSRAFTLPALHHSGYLLPAEVDEYRAVMARRIERRVEEGANLPASREAISLGNHYRSAAMPERAVELYEQAADFDPQYRARAYWWHEYAGVLFGSHRYADAADAYGKALELGTDNDLTESLRADALLYAGEYEAALEAFAQRNHDAPDDGEYRLKTTVLTTIVEERGLTRQERQPDQALADAQQYEGAEPTVETVAGLEALLEVDALFAPSWAALADRYLLAGDIDRGVVAHLAGALFAEGAERTPFLWAKASMMAAVVMDADLTRDVVIAGTRLGGPEVLRELLQMLREVGDDSPGLLNEAIEAAMARPASRATEGFTLRAIDADGNVNFIPFDPHD